MEIYNINNIDSFKAYCSLIYYFLENKKKWKGNSKKFPTVGNRLKLSIKGTRLQSIHLGKKRTMAKKYENCIGNTRYSELYKLLLELQNECFPLLQYNQILINKNNTFKPHKDSNNIKGNIFIFSIGDYIGDLHIEGIEYNTCLSPIIFNGKELEHSVPNIINTRYSILFYTI